MIKTGKKILVIGSSNTDMTVKTKRLPSPGETILGGCFTMGQGGKGANQAVAVSKLNGNAEFVCKVGKDLFGAASLEHYTSLGLSVSHCFVSKDTPSGVALISVDENAENCIVVASGANSCLSVEDVLSLKDTITSSSILLLQLEIPIETVLCAARIAWEAGVKVVLNPAPACPLPDEIYRYVSVMIPNQTEAAIMTGVTVHDELSAGQAASALKERGVDEVIITMGSKSAYVFSDFQKTLVPARKTTAVDTTAAGDTFCGAVCVGLAEDMTICDAVSFATVASSLSVEKMGAQDSIPERSDVDRAMKK